LRGRGEKPPLRGKRRKKGQPIPATGHVVGEIRESSHRSAGGASISRLSQRGTERQGKGGPPGGYSLTDGKTGKEERDRGQGEVTGGRYQGLRKKNNPKRRTSSVG